MLKQGWLTTELEDGEKQVKSWPEWMRRELEVKEEPKKQPVGEPAAQAHERAAAKRA